VKTVFEMPDDAIAQMETTSREKFVQQDIERKNLSGIDVIANLPTDAAAWF
jgi:hypothetical protein